MVSVSPQCSAHRKVKGTPLLRDLTPFGPPPGSLKMLVSKPHARLLYNIQRCLMRGHKHLNHIFTVSQALHAAQRIGNLERHLFSQTLGVSSGAILSSRRCGDLEGGLQCIDHLVVVFEGAYMDVDIAAAIVSDVNLHHVLVIHRLLQSRNSGRLVPCHVPCGSEDIKGLPPHVIVGEVLVVEIGDKFMLGQMAHKVGDVFDRYEILEVVVGFAPRNPMNQ